jgi:hypothetical protein
MDALLSFRKWVFKDFLLLLLFKWDSQSDAAASRWVLTTRAIGKTEYKKPLRKPKKKGSKFGIHLGKNEFRSAFERTISEPCAAEISGKKTTTKHTKLRRKIVAVIKTGLFFFFLFFSLSLSLLSF